VLLYILFSKQFTVQECDAYAVDSSNKADIKKIKAFMSNLQKNKNSSWITWYIGVAAVLFLLIIFFYYFTQHFA
jgi:hypothetical protein